MQTKSAKSIRPLYMLILSIIIIVAFFVISPTVAKAVDPPPEPEPEPVEEEEEEDETEPVEDGAAQIGAVEVTDGTIETFDTQPEIQDALGIPADTEIEFENTLDNPQFRKFITFTKISDDK